MLCSKEASVGAPREDDDCVSAISLCISRVVSSISRIALRTVKVSFWDMLSFSFYFLHCGESRRPNKKLQEEEEKDFFCAAATPRLSATAPFLIGNIAL